MNPFISYFSYFHWSFDFFKSQLKINETRQTNALSNLIVRTIFSAVLTKNIAAAATRMSGAGASTEDKTGNVDASSLVGLRLLQGAGLLTAAATTMDGEDNDQDTTTTAAGGGAQQSLWTGSGAVEFHDSSRSSSSEEMATKSFGSVALLNLGGKRLRQGLPCCSVLVDALAQFPTLRTLNLAGTDLSVSDTARALSAIVFAKSNSPCSSLEDLFLGGNGFGDEGAAMIARWLTGPEDEAQQDSRRPANLRRLDLRYNEISGAGMEALCASLSSTKVRHWHMEGNCVGDTGCAALSRLLQHDASCLEEVFLGANGIGPQGAAHVAAALPKNTRLSKLYLEGNHIGLQGATALSEALEGVKENDDSRRLKHLFVDNNNIGKEGSQRLARALNSGTAIPDGV